MPKIDKIKEWKNQKISNLTDWLRSGIIDLPSGIPLPGDRQDRDSIGSQSFIEKFFFKIQAMKDWFNDKSGFIKWYWTHL